MSELGATMRVLRPYPHVFGFYDGRIPGARAYSDAPNWLDDGAYTLGICSYAVVDAGEALVYDYAYFPQPRPADPRDPGAGRRQPRESRAQPLAR